MRRKPLIIADIKLIIDTKLSININVNVNTVIYELNLTILLIEQILHMKYLNMDNMFYGWERFRKTDRYASDVLIIHCT